MHRRIGTLGVVLALSVVSLTMSPVASGDDRPPAPDRITCSYTGESVPDVLPGPCDDPGDVIRVKLEGETTPVVGVEIPADGINVTAIADQDDGNSYTLRVAQVPNGAAEVFFDSESAAAGSAGGSGGPSKCNDYDFNYLFNRDSDGNQLPGKLVWNTTIKWYFNAASTPAGLTQGATSSDLQHAAAVISNTSSPCYSNDVNPVTQEFKGNYSGAGNVNSNSTCDSPSDFTGTDMVNSVAFGPITNSATLALTCLWTEGTRTMIRGELSYRIVGADIRMDDDNHNWANTGEPCTSSGSGAEYSVDGVATHEFGHVWGMGHVSEADHGNLTMSTHSSPCEFTQAELGIGDVSGIGHLYNVLN